MNVWEHYIKTQYICLSNLCKFSECDIFYANLSSTEVPQTVVMMTSSNGNIYPRYWPFVRGIHLWLADSPHKGQWRGTFMFSLICAWTNGWANNGDADDLGRHRAHYDITIMVMTNCDATSVHGDEKLASKQTIGFECDSCVLTEFAMHGW